MIQLTLKFIKEQTGLQLILCDYFTGLRENSKGEKYFNVELKQRTSESLDFDKLKRFADKYESIKIEINGLNRVAIFPKNIK